MKYIQRILVPVFFIGFLFTSCSSSNLKEEKTLRISKIDDIRGQFYKVFIKSNEPIKEIPNFAYYKDKQTSSVVITKKGQLLLSFIPSKIQDMIINMDPKKEFGNTVNSIPKNQFELKDNEVILGYKKGENKYMYKLVSYEENSVEDE